MSNSTRDISPCKDCEEKFSACHDRCPKDKRGDHGYGAYRKEVDRVNAERKKYGNKPYVKDYGY